MHAGDENLGECFLLRGMFQDAKDINKALLG
jgi:hypothetical protein